MILPINVINILMYLLVKTNKKAKKNFLTSNFKIDQNDHYG